MLKKGTKKRQHYKTMHVTMVLDLAIGIGDSGSDEHH